MEPGPGNGRVVAVIESGDALAENYHPWPLLNVFAQGAALMAGRASDDGARTCPGGRSSSTIRLDQHDALTWGALLAFDEHRTFDSAALLGINPFEWLGVEVGKEMVKAAGDDGGAFDASRQDLMKRAFVR